MSATASQPETDYFLRKLHSLTGIIPVGAFLAGTTTGRNSYALVSRAQYDAKSLGLQTIPFRVAVEWLFIFLPMLYHGGYGIWPSCAPGKSNVSAYPWVGNWLYTTQRYTGLIAFAYIGWHLYTERPS